MNSIYDAPAPEARPLDALENDEVESASKLSSRLIYEVIRRDGEEEMERRLRSLFWSGIAAGIMISLSVLGEAVLRTYLPDTPSSYLIENLGYSFGFIVVIMGKMQLFTENTITTVLPFMRAPSRAMFMKITRLWSVVLLANVIGAFAIAAFFALTPALPPEILPAINDLSLHATGMGFWQSFFRAIPAGILVAAIVWMLPQSGSAGVFIIALFTWLIAAGDFTHVVAGSVEMAYLVVLGQLSILPAITQFFIPVLVGNIVGGTAIFAVLVWGQVQDEVVKE